MKQNKQISFSIRIKGLTLTLYICGILGLMASPLRCATRKYFTMLRYNPYICVDVCLF